MSVSPHPDSEARLPSARAAGADTIAVFMADLHLGAELAPGHLAFRDFLARLSRHPQPPCVFILGDLFDRWSGDHSAREPGHRFVLLCCRKAAECGLQIHFVAGNRDFLFPSDLGASHGIDVLPSVYCCRLGSRNVVMTHGDALTWRDRSHLRFRWFLRSFWLRSLAHAAPIRLVERVARHLRSFARGDRPSRQKRDPSEYDIPPEAAARILRGRGDVVVCGHIHREACRRLKVDGRECLFYSLGAWEEHASVLVLDAEGFRFSVSSMNGDDA